MALQTDSPNTEPRNIAPLVEYETEIRVTYRDTDQMGMVYYANYFVYFETGRTELLRSLGKSYRSCEDEGIYLPVLEANCQYSASAKYDDLLLVKTRVTRWTRVALDFAYEVRRKEDDALLVQGTTRHVFINKDGRVIRAGDRILNA
jgi:acyl-CoA thioester hydrolase